MMQDGLATTSLDSVFKIEKSEKSLSFQLPPAIFLRPRNDFLQIFYAVVQVNACSVMSIVHRALPFHLETKRKSFRKKTRSSFLFVPDDRAVIFEFRTTRERRKLFDHVDYLDCSFGPLAIGFGFWICIAVAIVDIGVVAYRPHKRFGQPSHRFSHRGTRRRCTKQFCTLRFG